MSRIKRVDGRPGYEEVNKFAEAIMQPLPFVLAVSLLLATPGPTNTLLWLSGATAGPRRSIRLLLAEVCGYLTVTIPISMFARPFLIALPELGILLRFAAAVWVLFLARSLWLTSASGAAKRPIGAGQVFVTTLLNPKALVVALVIMPQVGLMAMLPWLAWFVVLTLTAGSLWIGAGAILGRGPTRKAGQQLFRRIAAGFLALFSLAMAGSALATVV
ncbi:LysE family translocator [Sinorhizobium alkalisoli]|nr:threonine transporter RhtB [Sinorhizobium alkalisoli]